MIREEPGGEEVGAHVLFACLPESPLFLVIVEELGDLLGEILGGTGDAPCAALVELHGDAADLAADIHLLLRS